MKEPRTSSKPSALMTRNVRLGLALCGVFAIMPACGGAVPLLHPARVLAPGATAFAAGLSDRLLFGDARRELDEAEQSSLPERTGSRGQRAALVAVVEGPALAAFASGRVGLPGSNEAGLSYSGQSLRVDARHGFKWGLSALSLGLGATGRGFGQSAVDLPGTDLSGAHALGVDVPVLFGYRSDADLISGWVGVRASFDHWAGKVALDRAEPFQLAANRYALGPLLGLAVGLPPFWVAAELEVDYAHTSGTLERGSEQEHASSRAWSVLPAGALIAKF